MSETYLLLLESLSVSKLLNEPKLKRLLGYLVPRAPMSLSYLLRRDISTIPTVNLLFFIRTQAWQ